MGMSLTQKAQDVREWVFFPQAHVMRLSKTGIRSSGRLMDAEGAGGGDGERQGWQCDTRPPAVTVTMHRASALPTEPCSPRC